MLVYSDIHDWENNHGVKQILVFACQAAKKQFEKEYSSRLNNNPEIEGLSLDSNCGAIFKLRAVRNTKKKYNSILRCGVTGELLCEGTFDYDNFNFALDSAKFEMYKYIIE